MKMLKTNINLRGKYGLLISSQSAPREMQTFIIGYHEVNSFSSLPALLWHPETRQFIEANLALRDDVDLLNSRLNAKNANDGLVWIATLILSTEILATGSADWAKRYPAARKKAQALLSKYVPGSRTRLAIKASPVAMSHNRPLWATIPSLAPWRASL